MINHIAFIMDGNRRWAKANGSKLLYDENQSKKAIQTAIEFCLENNIAHLSLYLFCLENFKRPTEEKNFFFATLTNTLNQSLAEFIKQEIKIRFIGERSLFPENTITPILKTEQETKNFNKLELNILFCYGGRQEIISATKKISQDILDKKLLPENINLETFNKYLWTYPTPNPEIIIRTGGDQRLSDFLLYQAAYSEIYFIKRLWPDLTKQDITEIIEKFKNSKKNFGR